MADQCCDQPHAQVRLAWAPLDLQRRWNVQTQFLPRPALLGPPTQPTTNHHLTGAHHRLPAHTHPPACPLQELESLAAELRDSALDPTLAACCQRDLQEQAAVAKLKARLAAADRTNLRKQVAQGVLRQGPPPGNAERQEEDDLGTSDEDEALGARWGWGWVARQIG